MLKERRDEAIAIFKLNIEMHPKSANAYDSLGEAYLKYNEDVSALEAFNKALELDPNNAIARSELTRLNGIK